MTCFNGNKMNNIKIYVVTELRKQSSSIQQQNRIYKITKCFANSKTHMTWLQVLEMLHLTLEDNQSLILQSILDTKVNIVAKFGTSNLKKEYDYSAMLHDVKGFTQLDSNFQGSLLVMNYYPLGSILSFHWKFENIQVLRSCVKQACLSIYTAFAIKKIIHGDFHPGNVLIKESTIQTILYKLPDMDVIEVTTHGYHIDIMDFQNSTEYRQNTYIEKIIGLTNFYYDLKRFFTILVFYVPTIEKQTIYQVDKLINICLEGFYHPIKLFRTSFLQSIDNIKFTTY